MKQKTPTVRLDRLLANLGYGSRKEIAWIVRSGAITCDGETLTSASLTLALTPDLPKRLLIDGQQLDPLPGFMVMMNKPAGYTCSHRDIGALVYDLLPARWRIRKPSLSTIGRLDKETTGLLLFTDDGDLLHRAISPKHHVAKTYTTTLDRPLRGDEAEILASGTLLLTGETKPLKPVRMDVISPSDNEDLAPVVRVTVTEGRYHQVRRMFAALGNHVTALHRTHFGGLALPEDLTPGSWRILEDADVAAIFSQQSEEPISDNA